MNDNDTGALHAFLAGHGTDPNGRTIEDVIALTDAEIAANGDFDAWAFPLLAPCPLDDRAPFLDENAAIAIRADEVARDNHARVAARMRSFYRDNDHWLTEEHYEHVRIRRIIGSISLLESSDAGWAFHRFVLARTVTSGNPVGSDALIEWNQAHRITASGPAPKASILRGGVIGAFRRLVGVAA